jgi:5'-nucleotidase
MSAAISFLKDTEIEKVGENVFSVDGTPADCTYFGLLGLLDFEFDIVVSGINHGANIGNDVLYSGTVGAAVGGRKLRYPPIAISVASYDAKDPIFIAKKSVDIINLIVNSASGYSGKVFNVNLPDINEEEYKGIKVTSLAQRGIPNKPVMIEKNKNVSKYRYNFSGEPIKGNHLTDAEAINDGYISISILDYDLDNNELIESFNEQFWFHFQKS